MPKSNRHGSKRPYTAKYCRLPAYTDAVFIDLGKPEQLISNAYDQAVHTVKHSEMFYTLN